MVTKAPRKSGQALIEFSVCMVGMLLVMGTLIQIGLLGQDRTRTYMDATHEATERSGYSNYSLSLLDAPQFIGAMNVGDDGKKYSADDIKDGGNDGTVHSRIIVHADAPRLNNFAGNNRISNLSLGNATLIANFEMVRGEGSDTVDLIPLVRNFMYNGASIDMENEVYMTWLKGLY